MIEMSIIDSFTRKDGSFNKLFNILKQNAIKHLNAVQIECYTTGVQNFKISITCDVRIKLIECSILTLLIIVHYCDIKSKPEQVESSF